MFNPDFWEVRLNPPDLERFANEAGLWFETGEESRARLRRARRAHRCMRPLLETISKTLTEKQRQVLLLYYLHQKTQEEVAHILGMSRRVVSQHLFGICRNGKQVGGALKKIRKACRQSGLAWRP
jgi:RNA polymerase sigma factor (sigma-70 family)